jgi:glycosyltransferase involved in cell wall biosynthesis
MKISIITCTYNSFKTIRDTLLSVQGQDYANIEYIIIDGGSNDGTIELVSNFSALVTKFVSQADQGIYDAMNHGISLATGDVIGFLHSDDVFADSNALSRVAECFKSRDLDVLYADIVYFQSDDTNKVVRRYRSHRFAPDMIAWGWMPAHPSLFLKRSVYDRYGNFKIDYKIAGDYEYVARIFKSNTLKYCYLPEVLVKMRLGGVSTGGVKNSILLNQEVMRACRENGISTNWAKILSKYPAKLLDSIFQN